MTAFLCPPKYLLLQKCFPLRIQTNSIKLTIISLTSNIREYEHSCQAIKSEPGSLSIPIIKGHSGTVEQVDSGLNFVIQPAFKKLRSSQDTSVWLEETETCTYCCNSWLGLFSSQSDICPVFSSKLHVESQGEIFSLVPPSRLTLLFAFLQSHCLTLFKSWPFHSRLGIPWDKHSH